LARPPSWGPPARQIARSGQIFNKRTAKIAKRDAWRAERDTSEWRESTMPQSNRDPSTAETGERVPARPHDSGSQANETVDGLDATDEALRHAAEDTA
jgi:hypothetical protein